MAIMPINNANSALNFGISNPIQNFGKLALASFVMNIISKLPVAWAKDSGMSEKTCEVICDPIAEGKDHPAERTCRQMCKDEKGVIRKATEWTIDKAGNVIRGVTPIAGPAARLSIYVYGFNSQRHCQDRCWPRVGYDHWQSNQCKKGTYFNREKICMSNFYFWELFTL
ncbi:MAG TPA: hypothetical protein VLG76_01535 [Rhabdochlamydiaceae bacterium]|nr:hypothetical protein [Rhabdochlamydiaceae bacterium]HSX37580.1 hypothetical protein [Chlamydiales bacterium]